jgi:hypothetical protein
MLENSDTEIANALSDHWDAVVSRKQGHHLGTSEELAGVVRRLHALDSSPPLPPGQRDQLWDLVLATHAANPFPIGSLPGKASATAPPSGRQASMCILPPHGSVRLAPRRWVATQLATAALVLLTLLAGYVALERAGFGRETHPVLGIPAIESPVEELAPSADESTIVLQSVIESIPPAASWIGIERTVLDPGTEITLGRSRDRGKGPLIFHVESGELTLRADSGIQVTPAGTASAVDIPPETDVTLSAGAQGFAPSGAVTRWRNDGTTPVTVLNAGITSYSYGWEGPADGVSYDEIVAEYSFVPPELPFELTVRRLTLQPSATLPVDAVPELEMLWVEAGHLLAVDAATPTRTARSVPFDFGTAENGNFRPGRVFRSADGAPVTLLVLTVTSAVDSSPLRPIT